ncbi:MAG: hypothetical protein QXS54_07610, partial [Candidatus Methanomethylicaceae archaeon]
IGSSSSVPGHVTAMRIAEEDMVWNMHNKERVRFSYLNYIAPGSVIRVKPFGYWRKAFAMDGSAYQITPDGSITAPSTALRVAIYFRLDGSSGQLISLGSSPNGFSVDVSQTQYTIRLGSYTGTVARKNSAGIPVRFAMCWAASYNKCYVFENGILLGSLTPGISTVSASGNFTVGSGFVGAIELIHVHASALLSATGFVSVLSPTPPGYICVCPWYSQQNGTWSTQPQVVDYEQPFVVERCIANETGYYDIIARAFTRRSLNAGSAPTSNNLVVSSYDLKPAGVGGPNPNAAPPSISGLFASATAYVQDNQTRYKVNLSWTRSQSPFVRGYNIYVNVGGSGDKLIAQLARNSNGYEYDVANPSLNHVFKVVPINLFGNAGSVASTAITPESDSVVIQSISGEIHFYPGLFSFNGFHSGVYGSFIVPIYVTGVDKIARVNLLCNGIIISSMTPTSSQIVFELGFDQPGISFIWTAWGGILTEQMIDPPTAGNNYAVEFILKNGNKIIQYFSPTVYYHASGGYVALPNPYNAPVFISGDQMRLSTPSQSPSPGDFPYKAPAAWEYRRLGGGAVTIPNGSTSAYAPFYVTFSSAPSVLATPQGNQMVWVTNVTTTGCTINRATTSGNLVVSYLAFGA